MISEDSYPFVFVLMSCPKCGTRYGISPDGRTNLFTVNISTGAALIVSASNPMCLRTDIGCDKDLINEKKFTVQTKSGKWLILEPSEGMKERES